MYYTALYYTAPTCFGAVITNTAFTYQRNLAGTDCELPEDNAVASKHVGAV